MRHLPAAVAIVASGLVAVAACATAPTGSPDPNGTLSPGPAVTASPAGVDPAYTAFRGRVQQAPTRFGSLVRDFASAISAGPGAIRAVATATREWAEGESNWLADHDREGCYGEAVVAYSTALELAFDAADGFEDVAAAASVSPEQGAAAGEALSAVSAALGEADRVTKAGQEACR